MKRLNKVTCGLLLWALLCGFLWGNVDTLNAQTIKIMPLGNSMTKGDEDAGSNPVGGYRDDLYNLLTDESIDFDFVGSQSAGDFGDNNHEGHPGWTADSLINKLNTWLSVYSPDIVLLMIGTNDVNSAQTPEGIAGEIEQLVDIIYNDNVSTKIVLASLVPRKDAFDSKTDDVNVLLLDMYYAKLSSDYKIYYAGINEMFKTRADWETTLMNATDDIHPNNDGYTMIAKVFFNSILNAVNVSDPIVTDNFNRSVLGDVWGAAGVYEVSGNELANTAASGWDYLATYKPFTNPTTVSIKLGDGVDAAGASELGFGLMLDAPTAQANGYFLRIMSNGNMDLWAVANGAIDYSNNIGNISGALSGPLASGDIFKVSMTTDGAGHYFDCYKNDEFIGRHSDPQRRKGNVFPQYAGIMLRGGFNNEVDNFDLFKSTDNIAPQTITDLLAGSAGATTATLTWTAPGDDGSEGTPVGYDIRYSENVITESNFSRANKVNNPPTPLLAGLTQSFVVTGLQPNTKYYFAIKAYDEVPNMSGLSNLTQATTSNATEVRDTFDRTQLGADWVAAPEFQIINGDLVNTASSESWNYMGVFVKRKNPIEVKVKWGETADATGISRGGVALMLTDPNLATNGYLAWRRTDNGNICLAAIEAGQLADATLFLQKPGALPNPLPGDEFKVMVRADDSGHHFDYYINDAYDGTISDLGKLFGEDDNEVYAGVVLHGNRNNNVDEFAIVNAVGEASQIEKWAGDNQTGGSVGRALPESLAVKVTDDNGNPVSGVKVSYEVTSGGGHFDLAVAPDNYIRIEAEDGKITSPMSIEIDHDVSNQQYITCTSGDAFEGTAAYHFYIETPGNYYFWGRVNTNQSPSANSWYFKVNGEEPRLWNPNPLQSEWFWSKVGTGYDNSPVAAHWQYTFTAGWHDLIVYHGNDNAKLDKLVIVNNTSWTPTGLEEYPEYKTDAFGLAKAEWTMGPEVGTNTAVVKAPGLQGSPVTFTASASGDIPSAISFVSGSPQSGAGGQEVPNPLVVKITDQYGNAKSGFPVTFVSVSGGGSFVESQPVNTNEAGEASVHYILGTESETSVVHAEAGFEGAPLDGSPVEFTFTATSHIASKMVYVSGKNQSGEVTTTLGTQLKVKIEDDFGNAIKNHSVQFVITQGPGGSKFTSYGTTTQTITTGSDGLARISLDLGTVADTNRVEARAFRSGQPLENSPYEFIARATPATAYDISRYSGNGQTGAANSRLANPFVVKIGDEYGNGVAGHKVTFQVKQGGGNFDGQVSTQVYTDGNGLAGATLTLGTDSEIKNIAEVSATTGSADPLVNSPVQFEATPGLVDKIAIYAGNNQKGSAGYQLSVPLSIKVTDNYGNPVPGHEEVLFTVKQGSGTFNGATDTSVTSNDQGLSQVIFTLGDTPGEVNRIEVNGYRHGVALKGNPQTFTATAHPATQIRRVSEKNESGTAGLPLADSVKVLVTDDQGVGLRNFQVKFLIFEGGGKVNGVDEISLLTNTAGHAAVQWTLGPQPGLKNNIIEAHALFNGNHLTFSPLKFWASAELGSASVLHIVQGDSQMAVVGGQLELPIRARVTDFALNPINQHKVVFTVMKGGGKINNVVTTTDQYTDPDGFVQVYWSIGNEKGDYNNELQVASTYTANHLVDSPYIVYASGMASSATKLRRISNETINGTVGAVLPQPFKVQVTDNNNNGVGGLTVTFEVTTGGGTLDGDTDTMVVKTSGEDGYAQVYLTVGPENGVLNTVKATASNGSVALQNTPMYFYSTGQTGPLSLEASTITFEPNFPAVGTEATIIIKTTDAFGNPISDKYVTIGTADEGILTQPTLATGSDGRTTGKIRANKSGEKHITAFITGVGEFANEGIVTFISLLGTKILSTVGGNQTGNVGAVLPEPLGIRVGDKFDNPVQGHEVTFAGDGQPDGSAIYELQPVETDANGWAYSHLILKQTVGQNSASTVAKDIGTRTYTATGREAVAADISKHSGDNQTGTAGVGLPEPFVVKVVDSNGWAVWNEPVKFSVEIGDGSFQGHKIRTVYSDRLGHASVRFTPDNKIGLNIVRAEALGKGITFTSTGETGEVKKLLYVRGNLAEGPVYGSPSSSNNMVVQTTDIYNNLVPGVEVLFKIISGDATILEAQPYITNQNGHALGTVKFGGTIGEVIVEVSSQGLINSPMLFKLYATSQSAKTMEIASGNGQQGTKGRLLPFPFEVKAVDQYGNPVKNVSFTWVVMSGSGKWPDGSTTITTKSDESGIARNWFKLGSVLGSNSAIVINQNLQNSPLEFTAEAVSNNFPLIQPEIGDFSIEEGQYLEFTVNAVDDDNDVIEYGSRASTIPPGARFDSLGTRKFTWTPTYQQAGNYKVWFLVKDSKGGIGAEEVTIEAANLNRKPVLEALYPTVTDISGDLLTGDPLQFSVTVSDPDQEPLIYDWVLRPHASSSFDSLLVCSEREYTFMPQEYRQGNYTISVTVTDTYDKLRHEWIIHNKTLVELGNFSAEIIENGHVKLTWETSFEKNNYGFHVLRSSLEDDGYSQINSSVIGATEDMRYEFVDHSVQAGRTYYYKLEDVDFSGRKTAHHSIKVFIERPTSFAVTQNYPNPFNPRTKIQYQLPEASDVRLVIFNLLGQKVCTLVSRHQQAGYHTVVWDGKDEYGMNVASGIYIYIIQAGEFRATKRMVLLK
ncbi:T9SS type A sorting domain-containing protein [candidate division KSB1 bacterium]|nr:T9SS type A sorting domain-containing protein [candidate division KSB1 bacterium]